MGFPVSQAYHQHYPGLFRRMLAEQTEVLLYQMLMPTVICTVLTHAWGIETMSLGYADRTRHWSETGSPC